MQLQLESGVIKNFVNFVNKKGKEKLRKTGINSSRAFQIAGLSGLFSTKVLDKV